MADEGDRAAARQEELTADAVADWQRRRGPARSAQDSAAECAECGDEIPEARRRAVPGCERCVECQHMRETAETLGL
jgi:phage/conjugal plasmid C-4 type zinc finger TraR family protein